jgi:hypothetical protein
LPEKADFKHSHHDQDNASRARHETNQVETSAAVPQTETLQSALTYIHPQLAKSSAAQRTQSLHALQQAYGNRAVQRMIAQARAAPAAKPGLDEQIDAESQGGDALPGAVRSRLETSLNHSLAEVRVHTDSQADRLARQVSAVAFTSGSHIFFRAGAYDPASTAGLHLLAHETAHTVQQAEGPVAGTDTGEGVAVSDPGDAFERAADRAAAAALAGAPDYASSGAAGEHAFSVQRQEESSWLSSLLYSPVGQFAGSVLGSTGDIVGLGSSVATGMQQGGLLGGLGQSSSVLQNSGSVLPALGGIGGALSLGTGLQSAFDPSKGTFDRGMGAVNAFSGGTSLLGTALPSTFGAGGAAGLGMNVTAANLGALGGGAALGTAGAVLGAGAAGVGIGTLLSENTRVGEHTEGIVGGIDRMMTSSAQSLGLMGEGENRSAILSMAEFAEENPLAATALGIVGAPVLIPATLGLGAAGLVSGAADAAVDYGGRAIDWGTETAGDVWNWGSRKAGEAASGIGSATGRAWDWASGKAGEAASGVGSAAGRAWDWASGTASEAASGVGSAAGSAWDWITGKASDAASGVGSAAGRAWDFASDTAGRAASGIGSAAGSAWDWASGTAGKAASGVGSAAGSAWDWASGKAGEAASGVGSAAGSAWDWASGTAGEAASGIGSAASSAWDWLTS